MIRSLFLVLAVLAGVMVAGGCGGQGREMLKSKNNMRQIYLDREIVIGEGGAVPTLAEIGIRLKMDVSQYETTADWAKNPAPAGNSILKDTKDYGGTSPVLFGDGSIK